MYSVIDSTAIAIVSAPKNIDNFINVINLYYCVLFLIQVHKP